MLPLGLEPTCPGSLLSTNYATTPAVIHITMPICENQFHECLIQRVLYESWIAG